MPNNLTTVIVQDRWGTPIPHARVLTGTSGYTVDASGTTNFSVDIIGVMITVSADGYISESFPREMVGSPYTIKLDRDYSSFSDQKILIQDQTTKQPIAGARLYFGASYSFGPTPANGIQWVLVPNGVQHLRVVATGYVDFNQDYNVTSASQLPTVVNLSVPAPVAKTVTVTSAPANVQVVITGPAGQAANVSTGAQASVTVTLAPGTYTCVASCPNYPDLSKSLTVTADSSPATLNLVMVAAADSGTAETPAANQIVPPTGDSAVDQTAGYTAAADLSDSSLLDTIDETDYEWIYPNSENGKYFTATQARMYIGNLFVDELQACQFAHQRNRIPIYGYCSEEFDAIGRGRALVQGQIVVNFISEGYLYTILKEHAKLKAAPQVNPDEEQLKQLWAQRFQLATGSSAPTFSGASLLPVSTTAASTQQAQLASLDSQITALSAKVGKQGFDRVRQHVMLASSTKLKAQKSPLRLSLPFDIEVQLEGAGRTVLKKIEKCVLTSSELIFDQSGNPLAEAYGFMARGTN